MTTPLSPDEVKRLQHALDAEPDAEALTALAHIAAHEGRWDDALTLARAVTVANPRAARAWVLTAVAYEGKGELDEARRAFETACSLDDKDLDTAIRTAELQAKTGKPSAARALATYVVLHERGSPALTKRAQALIDALEGRA